MTPQYSDVINMTQYNEYEERLEPKDNLSDSDRKKVQDWLDNINSSLEL